jgi:hypothetical protein
MLPASLTLGRLSQEVFVLAKQRATEFRSSVEEVRVRKLRRPSI